MKNRSEAGTNGGTPPPEHGARDQLMRRLVQVENWVSSPSERPGGDARSKLEALFQAADDLNFAFASLPKETFGINEAHISSRIHRLLDFCERTSMDRTGEAEHVSTFASLSGEDGEPDFLSHREMSSAEQASEQEEAASRGRRAS